MLPAIEYQLAPNPAIPAQPDWQQLASEYPWYPVAHWQQALLGDEVAAGRFFSFVQQPLRCHVLLSQPIGTEADLTASVAISPESAQSALVPPEVAAEPAAASIPPAEVSLPPAEETAEPVMAAIPASQAEATAEANADEASPADTPSNEEAAADDDALLFQPYHTVDYFASLGIKMDPSLLTNSQFDRQLKSFTQWLKGMKRMNTQTGQFSDDPLVTRQATESLQKDPVITAAMAEVLARQGLKSEAIALYRKLSLLHPEKSAFFASQIEKLTQ